MTGYSKLFASIVTSTIWREDIATKVVWITMLALKDQHGIVEGSIPGLAHMAGVTVEQAEIAVAKFLAPDPYSRSSEYEGRRIEVVDGGVVRPKPRKIQGQAVERGPARESPYTATTPPR